MAKDGVSLKSLQWLNYIQTTDLCDNGKMQIEHSYFRKEKEIICGDKKYKGIFIKIFYSVSENLIFS